jgi:DNA mismatch endonuclease, patch repair protein
VAASLEAICVDYEKQVAHLPGRPDFFVPSLRLVIFVNGCFWHGHDRCSKGRGIARQSHFWIRKIATNRRRDRRNIRLLRSLGYSVFTLWECRVSRGLPYKLRQRLN